jgi:tRNA threonylcarbamoyladenosine modification (KEOPS) complex Cgi121 subunit
MKESKITYIHETNTLHCREGELHIEYGDNNWVVFNVENLFKDLGFIISEVIRENKKQQRMYISLIKEQLQEL